MRVLYSSWYPWGLTWRDVRKLSSTPTTKVGGREGEGRESLVLSFSPQREKNRCVYADSSSARAPRYTMYIHVASDFSTKTCLYNRVCHCSVIVETHILYSHVSDVTCSGLWSTHYLPYMGLQISFLISAVLTHFFSYTCTM